MSEIRTPGENIGSGGGAFPLGREQRPGPITHVGSIHNPGSNEPRGVQPPVSPNRVGGDPLSIPRRPQPAVEGGLGAGAPRTPGDSITPPPTEALPVVAMSANGPDTPERGTGGGPDQPHVPGPPSEPVSGGEPVVRRTEHPAEAAAPAAPIVPGSEPEETATEHKLKLPRDTHIETIDNADFLVRGRDDELHFISHRHLDGIDAFFNFGLTGAIDQALAARQPVGGEEESGSPVQVIDVGGGMRSVAVKDLEERYGGRVHAVNIDIAHDVEEGAGAKRAQADARQLPLANASADVVYSRQLLPYIGHEHGSSHEASLQQALSEIARVLKDGGTAILDDNEQLSGPNAEEKRNALAAQLGVELSPGESLAEKTSRKFPKVWQKHTRRENFLIMKKPHQQQSHNS